jgi:Tripartite tricarboxylate transporter TctB family
MEPTEQAASETREGTGTRTVEIVVAVLIFILGAVVVQGSRALGSGWASDGPGAGYFPFYIGLILCIAALGVAFQALVNKDNKGDVFVDRTQLKQVLAVFLPALVYVGAVQFLGLYVASAIYIALFMIILGKFSPVKSIITALAVTVLFFMTFEVWCKVPLFKGKLEPLSFLGY